MHVAYTFFRKKSIRNYITWRICSHHYNSLCDYMRRSDCGVFNNNTAAQPTVWRTKRTARHLQTIAFIILTLFSRSPLSPSLPNTTCSCLPSSLHSFRTPGISPIAKKKRYDRRKNAAIEIQRVVEQLVIKRDFPKIEKLANSLHMDFVQVSRVQSANSTVRSISPHVLFAFLRHLRYL